MVFLDATDRRLLKLAWPAFLTLSAEPLYILVDNAIVGHISTTALGGLAIAGTILSTISWLIASTNRRPGTSSNSAHVLGTGMVPRN